MPNQTTLNVLSNKIHNSSDYKVNKITPKADDIFTFLSSLNEFSLVEECEIKLLAESCRITTFDAGKYLAIEGEEEGKYGYIVISGLVAMTKTSINGKELIVELLQANDCFGLLLMLAKEQLPYQLSARTLKKSKLLLVPISSFTKILNSHPTIFKLLISHLLICLQSSYRLSRGLAHDHVKVRIASILCTLAIKSSKTRSLEYTINFTRQQLADLTGTTPETAIRVTREMQRQNLIEISRPGVIRILDLEGLQKLTDD